MDSPDRESITLYHFEDESIRIDIVARFEGNDLIIDGYDIGKKVAEYFGDSDYEYVLTIRHEHIRHLAAALDINTGNPSDLLTALATKFTGNHCFSQLQSFLEANTIKHESFSWR